MNKYVLVYTFIFLFTISCKKDDNPNPPGGGASTTLSSYPLKLGNEWKYHTTVSFTSDSFNAFINDFSTYRFDSLTSFGGYDSIYSLVTKDSSDDGSIYNSSVYYIQDNSGLYKVGYIYGSGPRVFLKTDRKVQFKLGNKVFDSLRDVYNILINSSTDSLIIENPPLLTLKYPAVQNETWTYRNYDEPFYIGKKYIGLQTVSTNAGVFQCYKVIFLYDINKDSIIDPDITTTQFISPSKGLVKTDFQSIIEIMDMGVVVDTGYFSQQSILTSVNF